MERLARAVTIVDRETRKLQAELNEVTKEIDEAEKELLADMEGDGLTEQEMEREVVRLRVEVTNLCQSTVERMKESEKVGIGIDNNLE
jgi:predicted  nucleic acid-binding Zn-ribbon protein